MPCKFCVDYWRARRNQKKKEKQGIYSTIRVRLYPKPGVGLPIPREIKECPGCGAKFE